MPEFATWLRDQPNTNDADLAELQTYANGLANWPYWSDKRPDYDAVLNAAPAVQKDRLKSTLAQKFGEWKAGNRKTKYGEFLEWFKDNTSGIGLVIFGVFIATAMAFGLFSPNFYSTLGHIEQTRGLITFLFVLSTSGIILLIAIAVFWMDEKDNIKDRFAYAKDLLTVVIGVLGTILGFYFGTQGSDSAAMGFVNVTTVPTVMKQNEAVTIKGNIVGGKLPYRVTIEFNDPTGVIADVAKLKQDIQSTDGSLSQAIKVDKVNKTGVLLFTLTAKDAKSGQAQSSGAIFVQNP